MKILANLGSTFSKYYLFARKCNEWGKLVSLNLMHLTREGGRLIRDSDISTLTPSQNGPHESGSQIAHNKPGIEHFWIHQIREQTYRWSVCKTLQISAHSCICP